MTILANVLLLGWIPAVMGIFAILPPRRAMIASFVTSWLLLPAAGYGLPGLPDYTKTTATSVGILLAAAVFCPDRLLRIRPRWFDLPMVGWCVAPFLSSLTNGLGAYDGASGLVAAMVNWGLPYLIGRAFMGDRESFRELAIAIVIGGLIYTLPCLLEIRFSPLLSSKLYGISGWEGERFSGYRPRVFLSKGLELGMWMSSASMLGYWLWASGGLKRLWGLPFGLLLIYLMAVTILCRSTGALLLSAAGIAVYVEARLLKTAVLSWAILLASPLYVATRATGIWSARELGELTTSMINEERAESVLFRVINENMLIDKALERPAFGWGGYGRSRVYVEDRDVSVTDGLWIIALGQYGFFGLACFTSTLLLPAALLPSRFAAARWRAADVAPGVGLTVLMSLYMLDNLSNAMPNPIYFMVVGGLMTLPGDRRGSALGRSPGAVAAGIAPTGPAPAGPGRSAEAGRLRERASALEVLARSLTASGAGAEAIDAREQALAIRDALAEGTPAGSDDRRRRTDARNDLAWALAHRGGADAARAVDLARIALVDDPARHSLWNTLGAASYRAGLFEVAVKALERSTALGGGTGFDFAYLALALRALGDHDAARDWSARAFEWAAEHRPDHDGLRRLCDEANDPAPAPPALR